MSDYAQYTASLEAFVQMLHNDEILKNLAFPDQSEQEVLLKFIIDAPPSQTEDALWAFYKFRDWSAEKSAVSGAANIFVFREHKIVPLLLARAWRNNLDIYPDFEQRFLKYLEKYVFDDKGILKYVNRFDELVDTGILAIRPKSTIDAESFEASILVKLMLCTVWEKSLKKYNNMPNIINYLMIEDFQDRCKARAVVQIMKSVAIAVHRGFDLEQISRPPIFQMSSMTWRIISNIIRNEILKSYTNPEQSDKVFYILIRGLLEKAIAYGNLRAKEIDDNFRTIEKMHRRGADEKIWNVKPLFALSSHPEENLMQNRCYLYLLRKIEAERATFKNFFGYGDNYNQIARDDWLSIRYLKGISEHIKAYLLPTKNVQPDMVFEQMMYLMKDMLEARKLDALPYVQRIVMATKNREINYPGYVKGLVCIGKSLLYLPKSTVAAETVIFILDELSYIKKMCLPEFFMELGNLALRMFENSESRTDRCKLIIKRFMQINNMWNINK